MSGAGNVRIQHLGKTSAHRARPRPDEHVVMTQFGQRATCEICDAPILQTAESEGAWTHNRMKRRRP